MYRVELENVVVTRRVVDATTGDLKGTLFSLLRHRLPARRRKTILAGITAHFQPGDKVGIIGTNGSGKSTLLKLMAGVLRPTSGTIRTEGTIAALIELGAGFDPDVSVEENVITYGILLGRPRRTMRDRLGPILAFAELTEYRTMPLRTLSSGMSARLGFAVATDAHPEILLLDEVFAVGDEAFRRRSTERMRELWTADRTIFIVSHDLDFITENCTVVLWIDDGRVRETGDAALVVAHYRASAAADGRNSRVLSAKRAVGHVESTAVENATLIVSGWAVPTPDMGVPQAVAVFVDGHFVFETAYGDVRHDIEATLRDARATFSGFHGSFPLARDLAGVHTVTTALVAGEGRRLYPFGDSVLVEISAGRA